MEKALDSAIKDAGGVDDVAGISIAGQQHGMVALDSNGEVIRPALLWNDTRSAKAAEDLNREEGGNAEIARKVGSVLVASFTASKLRWMADNEAENAARVASVALPHDWLSWQLQGGKDFSTLFTDRSDASGTGYFDPTTSHYREDILRLALRHDLELRLPKLLHRTLLAEQQQLEYQLPQVLAITLALHWVCKHNLEMSLFPSELPAQLLPYLKLRLMMQLARLLVLPMQRVASCLLSAP